MKPSLAIAYAMSKKKPSAKMGESNGEIHAENCPCAKCGGGMMADGGEILNDNIQGVHKSSMGVNAPKNRMEKSWAGESNAGENVRSSDLRSHDMEKAKNEHKKVLGELMAMKKPKLMAQGGKVKGVHEHNYEGPGNSPAGSFSKSAVKGNTSLSKSDLNNLAKNEHERVLNEGRSIHPKLQGLYEGGVVDNYTSEIDPEFEEHREEDMIDRIMAKHQDKFGPKEKVNEYSEGGQVANETENFKDEHRPNEFDNLVLDDDLEFHDDDKNSGDDLGNKALMDTREDLVEKIMRSLAKKDRLQRFI